MRCTYCHRIIYPSEPYWVWIVMKTDKLVLCTHTRCAEHKPCEDIVNIKDKLEKRIA